MANQVTRGFTDEELIACLNRYASQHAKLSPRMSQAMEEAADKLRALSAQQPEAATINPHEIDSKLIEPPQVAVSDRALRSLVYKALADLVQLGEPESLRSRFKKGHGWQGELIVRERVIDVVLRLKGQMENLK